MSSIEDEKFPLESNTIVIDKTLDLSSIIDKLNDFSEEDVITTQTFKVDDLNASISFRPKLPEEDDELGLYLYLEPVLSDDLRIVTFSAKCGYGGCTRSDPINEYKDIGCGWSGIFDHIVLDLHKKIHFTISLHQESYHHPIKTFETQLNDMWELSKKFGDTKLMIKIENEDNESCNLQINSPPTKKRKLNASFQCEICDQQFDTQKGLTVHQTKKMDDAHKQFRNKNNSNTNISNHKDKNESLDDDEQFVLISSSILRSASIVFDRMLNSDMKEKQENKIVIHAKNIEDVEELTYFMCTNKLGIFANALNLVHMAHYYEMDRLFWQCVKRLIDDISLETFVQTVKIFDKYEIDKGYYQTVVDFGKKNVKKLQKRDDFHQLSHLFRCIVLSVGK